MAMKLREKVSENFTPREVVLFLKISENVVPFATGSGQKFKPDFFGVKWKSPCVYLLKSFV